MRDRPAVLGMFMDQTNATFFLGPRPGKKSIEWLRSLELTHCCTLLSEREDVRAIEKICQKLGCKWVWLPLEGGRLDVLQRADIGGHVNTLAREIEGEPAPRIYFHCSAGIHRTGFFVYVLLRMRGLSRDDAFSELATLRAVTADQVGEDRLQLADDVATQIIA